VFALPDAAASTAWPHLRAKVKECLEQLDDAVKHLSETNKFSRINIEHQERALSLRISGRPESDEPGSFPARNLPVSGRNTLFYGREDLLLKINNALDWRSNTRGSLRTYTIYGRRGVGKTAIALEYAYSNPAKFDAVFWIQCETPAALRRSIAETALTLNLPEANKVGHYEENLFALKRWLKRTCKCFFTINFFVYFFISSNKMYIQIEKNHPSNFILDKSLQGFANNV
jgi:hypothetical protein